SEDFRADIVRHHRAVILGLEALRETPGELQSLVPDAGPILLEEVAELDDQSDRHRGLAHFDILDLLRYVIFQKTEVAARNSGNEVAAIVDHCRVDGDDIDVALELRDIARGRLFRRILLQLRRNLGEI